MVKPQIPHNEAERLQALKDYEILDTLPEKEFDDITKIASVICNSPIALISLVDEERQWFKSKIGIDVTETHRDFSFCAHSINEPDEIFEIQESTKDKRFKNNPLVQGEPKVIFYAGSPLITPDGLVLGTLCVIDNVPRKLNNGQRASLGALARQVMTQLELRKQNTQLEKSRGQFQKLIENVDDYVFETNAKGVFSYCNPLMSKDTGFSNKELTQMHYLELVHVEDRDRVKKFYQDHVSKQISESYIKFRVTVKNNPDKELIVGQKAHITYNNGKVVQVRAISRNITNEVQLQKKLDENAKLFKLISETAQDIVCLHSPNGAYTYVSPSIEDNLGYKPEEIIGKTPYDLMHPDDVERAKKDAHRPLLEGERQNYFEYRLRNKAGDYLWFESISTAIEDENGKVTSLRSSTRSTQIRKEQETIINDQNYRLESFVQATPAPVAMFDKDVNYLTHSDKWLTTYGLEGKHIIGVNHYELFPEIGDEWKKIHQECLSGITHRRDEDSFPRADGTVQWLKWEVRPWYHRSGEIGGIIMLTDDITKNKEQELELIEAKERAEIASEAKANFLSIMSHEIRTPLNAVIGMSHLLMQENPRPDQLQGLKIIRFSSENLLSLVNDILDYNKIEAGKVELETTTFSLEELAGNIKQAQSYRADEKSIALKLLYDQDIPKTIVGDPSRLSQIMNNLLSNAIKFTKEGSVKITIEVEERSDEEVKIYFEFKDTGIGISSENVDRIFDRFVQAETNITRNFGGTGLGLSITKRLLNIMGGEIHVDSKIGKGSTFYFSLSFPYIENAETTASIGTSYNTLSDLSSFGLKVLLVEDNQANQIVATKFLNNWGVTVDIANNGFEALEMIENQGYGLVLMDLQMPKKDGLTASKEIRALEGNYFKNIPILALTASSDSSTMIRTRDFGMNDIIIKPFIPSELYRKVYEYGCQKTNGQAEEPAKPIEEKVDIEDISNSLLSFTGGDEAFLTNLLSSFVENIEEFIEKFPACIKEKNASNANFLLHKIRTTFQMCGLEHIIKNVEFCIQTMEHEEAHPVLPGIISSCEHVRDALNSYIESRR